MRQFNQLEQKLHDVKQRLLSKQVEVSELNTSIEAYKQVTVK